MPATFGLSVDGFLPKSLTSIREDLNEAIQSAFGTSIDVSDRSVFGQLAGILAERYSLLWEQLEAVYSSQDPDKATGAALEALCALTGTFKPVARASAVILTLTGTPATTVTAGSGVSTLSTGQLFKTRELATITALSAWVATTSYLTGVRVTNSARCYECTTAGTSSGISGPTTTDADITDNTVHWTYIGEGTGAIDVVADASETGVIAAIARDLTEIENSISGWSYAINLEDADLGRDEASPEELRLLREQELSQAGTSSIDAIRAALVSLANVISVDVFVNNADTTNGDGMPPHSVEALVRGPNPLPTGFSQAVFDTLLANVAAGIQTYGSTSGTSVDSQGTSHTMKYSQPVEIPIYITIKVTYDADLFPTDGATQIKEAIVDFGDAQKTGKDAIVSSIQAQAFDVDGVLGVDYIGISTSSIATVATWAALTVYSIGNVVTNSGRVYRCTSGGTSAASGGPTSTSASITDGSVVWAFLGANVAVSLRELATFDTSRITVTSAAGTP